MRLINTRTLELKEFVGSRIYYYAILSHTWEEEEVTFQDWGDLDKASSMKGFQKIKGACERALKDGWDYVWVDTNCIDKSSSAELSEAINSMFAWYSKAQVCYVYLSDVSVPHGLPRDWTDTIHGNTILEKLGRSRWFNRGWTLQELLAPLHVMFFSRDWECLGSKYELSKALSKITGIDERTLQQPWRIWEASIARRMSWAARRETTRPEDRAYSLLGIFDINMPLLYGEGDKAFRRLQEEIIKTSNDETIFCWTCDVSDAEESPTTSILAPSPYAFQYSALFERKRWSHDDDASRTSVSTYMITNAGLSIQLPVFHTADGILAVFHAWERGTGPETTVAVPLREHSGVYHRRRFPLRPVTFAYPQLPKPQQLHINTRFASPWEVRRTTTISPLVFRFAVWPTFETRGLVIHNIVVWPEVHTRESGVLGLSFRGQTTREEADYDVMSAGVVVRFYYDYRRQATIFFGCRSTTSGRRWYWKVIPRASVFSNEEALRKGWESFEAHLDEGTHWNEKGTHWPVVRPGGEVNIRETLRDLLCGYYEAACWVKHVHIVMNRET